MRAKRLVVMLAAAGMLLGGAVSAEAASVTGGGCHNPYGYEAGWRVYNRDADGADYVTNYLYNGGNKSNVNLKFRKNGVFSFEYESPDNRRPFVEYTVVFHTIELTGTQVVIEVIFDTPGDHPRCETISPVIPA